MRRVVFDTVIFVRALLNPHSRCGQLVFEEAEHYTLVISQPLVLEYLEVLRRPELTALFRTLPGRDPARVLGLLAEAEAVEVTDIPPVSRDPADDMFFATAKAAGADYLVSEDKDQLVVREFEGTSVVDAQTFLEILAHGEGR